MADLLLHERAVLFGPGSKIQIRLAACSNTATVSLWTCTEAILFVVSATQRVGGVVMPSRRRMMHHCPDLVLPGCLASRHSSFQRLLRVFCSSRWAQVLLEWSLDLGHQTVIFKKVALTKALLW